MGWKFFGSYNNSNQVIFQLDIVGEYFQGVQWTLPNCFASGFLAILGEGSVETVAQVLTLSNLVYLPRLIPAPQIFIRPTRPDKLETVADATVVGVHSGNSGTAIHHVAHALHRGDKLPANSVRCVRVTEDENIPRPSIRRFGPLAIVACLGMGMSGMLLGLSIAYSDGMSIMATILLSLLSTVAGVANKWTPSPNAPNPDPHAPPGDVVIRYAQGAFIIVKCQEKTSRYLYFNPSERCIYMVKSSTVYRLLSLISTLLLMGGVICLANAYIQTQTAWAVTYMFIQICYWACAALPPANHWDLSRIHVEEIELRGGAPPRSATVDNVPPTYTEALWKAIAVTGTKDWVRESGWAPKTDAWAEWLHEAEDAAKSDPLIISMEKLPNGQTREIWKIRNWDFKKALSTLMRPTADRKA